MHHIPRHVGNIVTAHLLRAKDQVLGLKSRFTEPSSELLLPERLPYPYTKPYTLVIELKDVLLHSEYDVSNNYVYRQSILLFPSVSISL